MKKIIFTIIFTLSSIIAHTQCIKGDCQEGEGTYRYDTGKFEGVFKKGDPFKGVYTDNRWGGLVFEGYFIDTENGPALDPTKKGRFKSSDLELKGFITKVVQIKDGTEYINWELNGTGELKFFDQSGGFMIKKGNFINNDLDDNNAEIIYLNGNKYVGGVVNGKRQGLGKIITPDGGTQQEGNWYDDEWIDANKNNPYAIPIIYDGNSIYIEAGFGDKGATKEPFVLDSGASQVLIKKSIFEALQKLNLIKIKDSRDNSFQIANGDIIYGQTYVIDEIWLGKIPLKNIECSVLENEKPNSENLLGLNALLAFNKKFSVNIESGELNFN